jgi:hypothetical protein
MQCCANTALTSCCGVPKQGESLRFFLRGSGRQETQIILFDKGLAKERPDSTFGTVMAAIALSQIRPVTEQAGHYLASRLRPVAIRLKSLLAEPRLMPAVESGNLHHALGVALTVIGTRSSRRRSSDRPCRGRQSHAKRSKRLHRHVW